MNKNGQQQEIFEKTLVSSPSTVTAENACEKPANCLVSKSNYGYLINVYIYTHTYIANAVSPTCFT